MGNKGEENIKNLVTWHNTLIRSGKFPLDRSEMFDSLEDAKAYAKGDGSDKRKLGGSSYTGQTITVYESGNVSRHIINEDRTLSKLSDSKDNDELKQLISNETENRNNAINALNNEDISDKNKYISRVSESKGIVSIERANLIGNNGTDSILSIDDINGGVKANVSLMKVTEELPSNVKERYALVGKDSVQLGDIVIDIYKDRSLQSAELVTENDKGQTGQFLKLTYNIVNTLSMEKQDIVYVDMSQLVSETEVSDGLQIIDGITKVRISSENESEFFEVIPGNLENSGLKVKGIKKAINDSRTVVSKEDELNTNSHLSVNAISSEKGNVEYKLKLNDVASEQKVTEISSSMEEINGKISSMNLPLEGGEGRYIKSISQVNGVLSVTSDIFKSSDIIVPSGPNTNPGIPPVTVPLDKRFEDIDNKINNIDVRLGGLSFVMLTQVEYDELKLAGSLYDNVLYIIKGEEIV